MKIRLRVSAILTLLFLAFSLQAQTPGPVSLSNGLVAWLQFDEQTGTRAQDASGSGRSGQLGNGGGWEPGKLGQCVTLSGNQHLTIPFAWQPAAFTVSWWVKPEWLNNFSQAVGAGLEKPDVWTGFLFHASASGKMYAGTDAATSLASDGTTSTNTLLVGQWQQITFTFNRGEAALYKDGVRIAYRSSGMTMPAPWQQLSVGSPVYGYLSAWGKYDDLRVYDRALSSQEAQLLFTNRAVAFTPLTAPSTDLTRNWGYSRSFDGEGNIIGEGKAFADALGRPTQSQVKSQTSGHVLATQTIYSSGGKPVLSTLAAPINNAEFSYKEGFITANGRDYSALQFEQDNAQTPVVPDYSGLGTLRYYYSSQNTLEPLTAATNYPFSLTQEYEGPSGGMKRAAGPGDQLHLGSGHESKSREFSLLNELDHYLSLRPQFVGGTPPNTSLWLKGEKAVGINADGVESISFTDADGRTLASCLSGPQYPGLTLVATVNATADNVTGTPVYQDIHVPAAGSVPMDIQGTGSLRVVNLLTDAVVGTYAAPTSALSLPPGFYRLLSEQGSQTVRYLARYGHFSYSYYDDAGRLVASVAPKGVEAASQSAATAGRAGHWSFEEAAGSVTADASGNGAAGTLVNQPSWSTSSGLPGIPPSPAGGRFLLLDGQDDYVRMGDVPALRLSNQFTIEAWIYPTANQDGILVNKEDEYEIGRFSDGSIQWAFWNTNPGWTWVNTGMIAPLNTWSHIGITYQDGTVTAYLNGVQVGTPYIGSGSIAYHGGEFRLGARFCCPQFFKGALDEVRIWNKVAPPSTGLVGQLRYVTRNTYSGAGPLLATESIDEGRKEYVYARDGRIRFSQSALQKQHNRFSYSNYDPVGRVVESGEYVTDASIGQTVMFENQLQPPLTEAYEVESLAQPAADIVTSYPGYRGTGFAGNLTSVGRGVRFSLTVPAAGIYAVNVRYAAGLMGAPRTMSLYVNGVDVQQAEFASTNSWSIWATQTLGISLPAGTSTLVLQYDAEDNGWINVDYLDLVRDRPILATSVLARLEDRTRAGGLDEGGRTQRNQVWYDVAEEDPTQRQWLGRTQEFVLGAVAKTSNGTSTTWYSYDDQGRVAWLVQKVPGVDKKTVDYTYDFLGNVLEVAYQKGQPDAFYHHYTYDADKRLRTVHTSPDGLAANRTLQARYFYYLHGPLKRVELADRLQGLDYTYTVQGWLKSINHAQKGLDPGQDNPRANGFLKDLFGLRLDYFDGDYRSRQLVGQNLNSPSNQNETRFDGTLRASTWHTMASPTVHGYAYRYDAKGQLLQSDYGQLTGGTTLANPNADPNLKRFEEGNLSYDANGNLLTLRRTDGMGATTDNFRYDYLTNTNKLLRTLNGNNAPVLSYEYDVNGQMTRESEAGKADKFLSYDVTGKVTGVYRAANFSGPVATYTYDDRGFRATKVTYDVGGNAQQTTYYVRDAGGNVLSTYEQAAGQPLQLTEVPLYGSSRLGTLTRLEDATYDARYELNDQLGNARVVFHRPKTTKYLATMSTDRSDQEEQDFENVAATRHLDVLRSYDDGYVAALTMGGEGPKKRLTVAKGDTVTFTAQALLSDGYFLTTTPSLRVVPLLIPDGEASVPGGMPAPRESASTTRSTWFSRLKVGVGITGIGQKAQARNTDVSLAVGAQVLIRYRYYNTSNELKAEGTKALTTTGGWQHLQVGFLAPEEGTLELTTLSTYPTTAATTAYFDHIEVEHTGGTIVQEQHQYAFGSPLTGLNYVVGNKRYRHGYQGQYAEKDEETGYDSFELRLYNSRLGRWTAPDPEGQFDSPYEGMSNNPVSDVDADGGVSFGPGDGLIKRSVGLTSMQSGSIGVRNVGRASSLGNISGAARALNTPFRNSGGQPKSVSAGGRKMTSSSTTFSSVALAIRTSPSGIPAGSLPFATAGLAATAYTYASQSFVDWSVNDINNNQGMGMAGLLEKLGFSPGALYGPSYGQGGIPLLKYEKGDDIGLGRFTEPGKKGSLRDPKSGDVLEKDKGRGSGGAGGGGPHGGSWWKLVNKWGDRLGTISKDGRWLRR